VYAFAALRQACILHNSNKFFRKRRGSASLVQNCFTGMGGELASLFWLRHVGLPAQMVAPSSAPDAGFDLACFDNKLKIEVKTSSFGNRGVEAMTHADRMPITRVDLSTADFYFWCITQPHPQNEHVSVYYDLLVTMPSGTIRPGPKAVSTPPGMRLRDIATMFSPDWFVEQFVGVLDNNITPIRQPGENLRPSDALAWASAQGLILVPDPGAVTSDVICTADRLYETTTTHTA